MKKRTVATGLTTVMLISLVAAACSSQPKDTPAAGETKKPDESKKAITFTWLAYDRPEGKVRQDWDIFKEIEAKTGVKVEFQVVSQEGLKEKKQIMIATNSVTDFIQVDTLEGRQHGPDKVFLNLKDYLDKAPNLKAFYDKYPEARAVATGVDGGIYTVPVIEGDAEGKGFNFVWYTRKDVMDKYGLKAPTTVDEFYQFLKTLKEKQPDTYPLINNAIIGDTGLFTTFGRAFTGIHGFYNVDPATDKYAFAPYHKGYKDSLVYLNKLFNEKLLDPEFSMITQAQWEERILKGKSLVTFFWKADLETLMDKGRKAGIAEYTLDAIPQFAADGIKNYQFSRPVVGAAGRAISAKVKDKDRAVQFLDYLLGEEGSNYLSLGIEGKTYTKENGKSVYNKDFGASPFTTLRKDWGVWYDMVTLDNAKSREVWERGLSDKSKDINKRYESFIIPAPKQIVKTKEELELEKSKLNNLNKFLEQKLTEFVAGKTPINDKTYQEFIDQAKKLGADELLGMYNAAYTRTYGKK
ncbi:extracellular solute-binding protein [Paenibacillus sp. V4I5]|uniref:extracellular solute-binding protein n=1 Tax=Paenibacillus sp. V4I5 TaxID=3042306 RepID=UPI00278D23E8|nr:extracellular solute-binding protein [Paenibacillus sp. V4I5]MDQ0920906.1 putative aldouronate transport system substrate-binding protein [Paenibacillus sp. V4I5]